MHIRPPHWTVASRRPVCGEPSLSASLVPSELGRYGRHTFGAHLCGAVRSIRQSYIDARLHVGSVVCEEDRASPSLSHATAQLSSRRGGGVLGAEGCRVGTRCASLRNPNVFHAKLSPSRTYESLPSDTTTSGRPRHPGGDGLAQVSHKILPPPFGSDPVGQVVRGGLGLCIRVGRRGAVASPRLHVGGRIHRRRSTRHGGWRGRMRGSANPVESIPMR